MRRCAAECLALRSMTGGAVYVEASNDIIGSFTMNEGSKVINNYGGMDRRYLRHRRCEDYHQRWRNLRKYCSVCQRLSAAQRLRYLRQQRQHKLSCCPDHQWRHHYQ